MLLKLKDPIRNRNIREPTKKECRRMNPLLTATHNPPLQFFVAGHGICGYNFNHRDPVTCPLYKNILQCFEITWTQCPANWNDNPKYSKNRFCAGGGGKDTRKVSMTFITMTTVALQILV
ncbi:trypsin-like [Arapaima gigas]